MKEQEGAWKLEASLFITKPQKWYPIRSADYNFPKYQSISVASADKFEVCPYYCMGYLKVSFGQKYVFDS